MIPDYYSDVQCHLSGASRDDVDAWLDAISDIGEDKAPGTMFDVDFSASFSRNKYRIGVQSAHRMPRHRRRPEAEAWGVFQAALGHAFVLLGSVGALAHAESFDVELTRIVGEEEITLIYRASGPNGIKVMQTTSEPSADAPSGT